MAFTRRTSEGRNVASENQEPHLTKTEARAGTTNHVVRYVLIISLILVIVAFAIIVAVGRV
jgi:hypothetical protein